MADLWDKELLKKKPSFYTVLHKIYALKILIVSLFYTLADAALRWDIELKAPISCALIVVVVFL